MPSLGSAQAKPVFLTGNQDAITAFLNKFDTFLFDCDGVLYSGNVLLPRTKEVLDMLWSKGKRTIFVTNNSSKSRAQCAHKFVQLGVPVKEEDVFGSAYSAAIYISKILQPTLPANRQKVFAICSAGVEEELRSCEIPFIGGTDKYFNRDMVEGDFELVSSGAALDPEVGIILLAADMHMNYYKTSLAMAYARRGAVILATNMDSTYPSNGTLFPGTGAMVSPVLTALGRDPLVMGKPSQAMMDAIEARYTLNRARTCMVGDRLNTDIRFGLDGNLGGTLSVLTGVSRKEEFLAEGADTVPSAYVNMLGDLLGPE